MPKPTIAIVEKLQRDIYDMIVDRQCHLVNAEDSAEARVDAIVALHFVKVSVVNKMCKTLNDLTDPFKG